ncbi:MAG: DUF2911 domain-containing protein [Flavobacteriaceae bacterium]|nr:DUF2911 domain-containing protein [Flavobacteriaceae bacterium]
MKLSKILKILAIVAAIFICGMIYTIFVNPASPRGSAEIIKDELVMAVDYSRPYKKDRLIFGELADGALVPYSLYWRLGANFATTFETNKTISFSGRPLEPGKYRMYTVPFDDHWKITLNTKAGAFGYTEPDYNYDIISVNVSSKQMTEIIEQLTIDFVDDSIGTSLRIRWDSTMVLVPLN